MQNAADYYKANERALYIETVKGAKFFMDAPVFDVEEIAHALAMQCRYTGHCSRFYSVAEHSILVADIMQHFGWGAPFEGLMHDGTEAYMSDIAAPWKALLPDYKVIEGTLERALRAHYNLPATITDECKRADWVALFVEADVLIPSKAANWISPPGVKGFAAEYIAAQPFAISGYNPTMGRILFLERFNDLHSA